MSTRVRFALPSLLAAFPALALSGELVTAAPQAAPSEPLEAPAAEVAWPVSSGLLLSELMTGGASASDEFIELYNGGAEPADLLGLEVAYVTASGSTVTRKASWSATRPLAPGQHLLLANVAGAYAAAADATYSGGLAATGGSLVLRAIGGEVVDAVGWGDASNAFVEGTVATAPGAAASLERRPGTDLGNGQDTNVNATDWALQPEPGPQGLVDPPTPPTPGPTEPASPSLVATATPIATASSTPIAATPTATLEPAGIATLRGLLDGTLATVEGVLTTPLGLVDGGQGAFLQDATGGIALYLDVGSWPELPLGSSVRASGVSDTRYGQATLRLAAGTDLRAANPVAAPLPVAIASGTAGETLEGSLVSVAGRVVGGPDVLSDGFAVDLDDGSGALRVVAPGSSGILPDALPRGALAALTGVLGQRDSSGTGEGGYRLYLRAATDVTPSTSPSPFASPSPTSAVSPEPSVTPTPTAKPTSSPRPSATDGASAVVPIASILATQGARVRVEGVVTSPPATWGVDGRRVTIQDASGAILVRLPSGVRAPALGQRIDVVGRVGHYLGAPQLAVEAAPTRLGAGTVVPRTASHGPLGTAWTWRLVTLAGRVLEVRHGATSWRAELRLSDGSRLPVAGGLSAIAAGRQVIVGARVVMRGIVRPPASGAADRRAYVIARLPADVIVLRATAGGTAAAGAASGSATGRAGPSDGAQAPLEIDLADLPGLAGRLVRAGGLVIEVGADRVLLDDGSGRARVRFEDALRPIAEGIAPGATLNVIGIVQQGPDGAWEIVPRSSADVILAGQLEDPPAAPAAPAGDGPAGVADATALMPAGSGRIGPAAADAVALCLALAAGLGLVAVIGGLGWRWRRRRLQRELEARVGARLAALSGAARER